MSSKKQQPTGWQKFANFFGVLGYLWIIVEWTWIAALYLPLLIENESIKKLLLPDGSAEPKQAVVQSGEPSLLLTVVAVTITFFVVVGCVILLIRLPLKVAKSGHTVIQKTAVASIPIVTHHRKISPKKKKLLTARLIGWLKIVAVLLPLVGLLGAFFVEVPLSRDIFILVEIVLALTALASFAIQYAIARWRSVPNENLL